MDGGRRRTPGWAALALAVGVLLAAVLGGALVYRTIPLPQPSGAGAYVFMLADRVLQNVCIVGPLYLAAAVMIHLVEGRAAPPQTIGPARAGVLGASAGVVLFLVALGLAAVLGAVRPGADTALLPHKLLGVGVGAALILFQAGGEEYFFRGWLQPALAARWGAWFGLGVTAVLFAASHALNRPLSPVAFLNDALAGAAFGLLALRTGGLCAPVAAHWGWNWAEQSLAGATPNPGVDPLGSLFDFDLHGPRLLSGGIDEMNGSLCATFALLALIAVAALLRPAPPAASR